MSEEITVGDVFIRPNGNPIQVKAVRNGYLLVTNPEASHPQDAEAGTWEIDHDLLVDDLESGKVKRGRVSVEEQ